MRIIKMELGMFLTNTYLFINDELKQAVIIDPALPTSKIPAILDEQNIKPVAILLTHGHFDHIGGVDIFREYYDIPLYLNSADHLLSVGKSEFPNPIIIKDLPDYPAEDGEVITLAGMEFTVIHTPGHTAGCVCYRCGDALITGDTIMDGTVGRTDLIGGSYEDICASVQKLREMITDNPMMYAGHRGDICFQDNMKKLAL